MKKSEIINGKTRYWEISPLYTCREKDLDLINSTNMTGETAMEVMKFSNWWYPSSVDKPYWMREGGFMSNNTPPRFILFDTIDGETQIVRFLEFINPETPRLNEAARLLYNPKEKEVGKITLPCEDSNPYKLCHPFHETEYSYIHYTLGGYGYFGFSLCLGDCLFFFHKVVPGIKPPEVMKEILTRIFTWKQETSEERHPNEYASIPSRGVLSFISSKGLFEILWDLGYQEHLYNNNGDLGSLSLEYVEKHRRSFLISRRHGVDFSDHRTLLLWVDTIKLLEKYGMDILNPRYIAYEFEETHDLLVGRENRRLAREAPEKKTWEERKKENEDYQESKKSYLGWSKESGYLRVEPVQSVDDCRKTGLELSNCCYSSGYYRKENSLFLKVYISGKLTELAEVGIKDHKIYQCLGIRNSVTPYHQEIIDFLKENIKDLP